MLSSVACLALVGKTGVKRLLGRPRLRWENNVQMEGVDRIGLVQDRNKWASTCESSAETSSYIKCGEILGKLKKEVLAYYE